MVSESGEGRLDKILENEGKRRTGDVGGCRGMKELKEINGKKSWKNGVRLREWE